MTRERTLKLDEMIQTAEAGRTTIHPITYAAETLPIYITKASREGPCVWVQAGTHGDEYDGIKACFDLSTDLENRLTAGTVILCPIANGPAYRAASAANPIDRVNLNRVFASGIQPSFSVEYGHWLGEVIASAADCFIDLHGGGHFLDVCPFGMLPAAKDDNPMKAIAQTLDLFYLVEIQEDQGMFINYLTQRGIHSILLESGGGHSCTVQASERHSNNVKRILVELGMLPDSNFHEREEKPVSLSKTLNLYFEKKGFLLHHAPCGTLLKSGDPIATVLCVDTFQREYLLCPVDNGVLLSVRTAANVNQGDYAAYLGYK